MLVAFVIFAAFIYASLTYLRLKYSYWESHGVHQLQTHFLLGNLPQLDSIHHASLMHEVYGRFKDRCRVAGAYIFTTPIAVLLDLDLIKVVLIKEFKKFTDRNVHIVDSSEPLAGHLFALHGDKWRTMRTKLSPTFTSGKMKFMFPTMLGVAKQLGEAFAQLVESSANGTVELHDIMARYTTDVIGSCVFGLECNSLREPNVEFRRIGNRVFYATKHIRWRLFLQQYIKVLRWFGAKLMQPDVNEFIMRVVRETVRTREQQHIHRNDFINLLIELKNHTDEDGSPGLTIEQIAGQVFIFFVAGFETSSSNMSYCLFELAKNPRVQERLRSEILQVLERHEGELTYEAMMEMTYLDQTISETLRKYPALPTLTRIAGEDFQLPGTKITIHKGTTVYIPVREIHYDPEIYKDPKKFNPDRFSPEEVKNRHPQAFLGFGDGPRNCIGLRFGRMQVRVGLIALLQSFKFSMSEKTPQELEISKQSLVMTPGRDGVWVKAEKLL